jgi:signal transduction histidine kinase
LRRQTDHLARLVDDLLDITRISRGKVELKRTRFDLRDVVRKTADDTRSVFDANAVELRIEQSAGPVWVDADVTRVGQIVGNLLHNGVKFTPAGGTVSVVAAEDERQALLAVRDTGRGSRRTTSSGSSSRSRRARRTARARRAAGFDAHLPKPPPLEDLEALMSDRSS